MKMPKTSLRELFLIIVIVSLAVAWFCDKVVFMNSTSTRVELELPFDRLTTLLAVGQEAGLKSNPEALPNTRRRIVNSLLQVVVQSDFSEEQNILIQVGATLSALNCKSTMDFEELLSDFDHDCKDVVVVNSKLTPDARQYFQKTIETHMSIFER